MKALRAWDGRGKLVRAGEGVGNLQGQGWMVQTRLGALRSPGAQCTPP